MEPYNRKIHPGPGALYVGDTHQRITETMEKNIADIPFAVGSIQVDVEKIRSNWGFESLPWLILTNSQHLVIDAGFGLSELNEKVRAIN